MKEQDSGDKELWDLMGKARKVEPGPMFSRNVVREVRLAEAARAEQGLAAAWLGWLLRPTVLTGFAAIACVAIGLALLSTRPSPDTSVVEVSPDAISEQSMEAYDPAEEYESIEMLGQLMAVSDPGTLSDEALLQLLF